MEANGKITLDSELSDCEVGVEKTITITCTPTKNGKSGFEATVTGLEEYDSETEGDAGEAPPEKPTKKPARGEAGPSDHVLMIGIGKMKPKGY